MSSLENAEQKLPGLRFRVKDVGLSTTGSGRQHGTILLYCETVDKQLWDMAVEKLDGFKLFSSTTEEIMSALSDELTSTDNQLQTAAAREQELREDLQNKVDEIARLRQILHDIGVDLGID